MSSALALASVTAVLREVLHDAVVDQNVTTLVPGAEVTAVAPDQIALGESGDAGLNVYLYGTTPNTGWRNAGLPSRSGDGARLTNPPLALDLHYLLTAYGTDDFHAEVLLGVGMQRLHEVPVLERSTVRSILENATVLSGALADSALADQVELVKIAPEAMGAEAMSKLWTAFQASYRPSAAYVASVVLVQAEDPVQTPVPVLVRGGIAEHVPPETSVPLEYERGPVVVAGLVPPFPTLTGLSPPDAQPAAQLGDTLRLTGHHLDGTGHAVTVAHTRFDDAEHELAPGTVAADALTVTVPADAPGDWPAGLWTARLDVTRDGRDLTTNTLAVALAPTMDVDNVTVDLDGSTATITVPVEPLVRDGQTASLVVGAREVPAEPFVGPAATLTFVLDDAPLGTSLARLRVDGVESVFIDRTASPPAFDPTQEVTIA